MEFGLVEQTAPASEPITTAEAKLHLKVDIADDDALIDTLIAAARLRAESFTRRQFITATYDLFLDRFPDVIHVPRPPLQSVTTVKYTDTEGNQQTLTVNDDYIVDANQEPGRICPAYGKAWPATREVPGAVEIRYVAGYGAAGAVPDTFKAAMKLMIGTWYEHRESVSVGPSKEVPQTARMLLYPERVSIVGARL